MYKCKDCEYFKDNCGFASVDKQLGLDGNFVACGQFKKSSVIQGNDKTGDSMIVPLDEIR